MNIAIVDDSSDDRIQLSADLEKYARENALLVHTTTFESGEAFLASPQFSTFNAVFLDIYMKKMGGMETAHEIKRRSTSCQIVFVSSTAAFAVQSYEVRAFYYILKPYSYADIVKVMNMLDGYLQTSSRFIKVKEGREWCKILLSDILYADYSNHYVQIHTESAIVSTYMKFSEIEDKLLVYSEFLDCYRCIVVNMNKIKKVDDLFFLLCNGEYVPINRKRVKEIKSHYTDYIFRTIEEGTEHDG